MVDEIIAIIEASKQPKDLPPGEIVVVPAPNPMNDMLGIIERMAGKIDADTMQKMLDMQLTVMSRQAEIEFNEAFTALSAKLPRIVKKGSVAYKDKASGDDKKAFNFATYEDIDEKVRPLLIEHGFSLIYDTEERAGGGLIMTVTLLHVKGHNRKSSIPLALDSSGGKNNIQAMGSSSSYGRRYAMCNILNIVTVGEDDDAGSAFPIDTEQAAEIDALIRETGMNRAKFLKVLKVEDVREIRQKDAARALNTLKARKLDMQEKAKAEEKPSA